MEYFTPYGAKNHRTNTKERCGQDASFRKELATYNQERDEH